MEVKLIIPALDNDGSDNTAVVENAISELCKLYGGATVYNASGYWINNDGRLFKDDVRVITSSATAKASAKEQLRELAKEVLAVTDQEAVYMSVGGEAEIIE